MSRIQASYILGARTRLSWVAHLSFLPSFLSLFFFLSLLPGFLKQFMPWAPGPSKKGLLISNKKELHHAWDCWKLPPPSDVWKDSVWLEFHLLCSFFMYMLLLKIRGLEKLRVDPESSSQGEFLPLFFFSSFCCIYDLYIYDLLSFHRACKSSHHVIRLKLTQWCMLIISYWHWERNLREVLTSPSQMRE